MRPKRRIIPLFIPNAGCAHNCVFCDQRSITGAHVPAPSDLGDMIRAAMTSVNKGGAGREADHSSTGAVEIAYYGGSFTALPEKLQIELLEASQEFLRSGQCSSVRVSTRPDCIDETTVERLLRYGVGTVEIGAQSMCDDVLFASRRGHTASDVVRASELIKAAGLSLILQMMTGLPGDTWDKSVGTARQFAELMPDGVRIYPAVVILGTELFDMWKRGEYREHTLGEAIDLCAKLCGIFEDASIPVIRLGLNPNDELSAGGAVAGAYHPALGELVYSRMYYNGAAALLGSATPGCEAVITVAKGRRSMMTGARRENLRKLCNDFSLAAVKVVESSAKPAVHAPIKVDIIQPC